MKKVKKLFITLFVTLSALTIAYGQLVLKAQNTQIYYVDCSGNDNNTGLSQTSAWATLTKASGANLLAGDQLLLKKGCTWTGQTLTLGPNKNGAYIGTYGTGTLPVISNNVTGKNNVYITGSNITIDGLNAIGVAPSVDAGCANNPVGHIVGFSFGNGAANNLLKNSQASGLYAAVYLMSGSHNNKINHNIFTNNIMMSPLDTSSGNDAGAFGVLIWGDDNEISHNTISGNDACSYDYGRDGSVIEIYGGQRNSIHHNTGSQSDAFTELGNSRSSDNIYAYNLFKSDLTTSLFLNTRGGGSYGPVYRTKAYNNTAYLTGSSAQGVVCTDCGTNILTFKNNIIVAKWKTGYANAAFDESNNIYWLGSVTNQLPISSSSLIIDPKFVNPSAGNFHLLEGSPAINSGIGESLTAGFTTDLDGANVANPPERGAYEYGSVVVTPSPSPSSKGDANGDGLVNEDDYAIWLANYGISLSGSSNGDFNLNGKVDGIDYVIWVTTYTRATPPPTIVPTPTTTLIPTPTIVPTPTTTTPTATPVSTPPAAGNHLIISIGDISRTTGSPSLDVANSIKTLNPEAIIMTGDYDQGTGTLSDILAYPDKLYGPKPGGLYPKIYPAAGPTHDVASCTDQLGYSSYWGKDAFKGYSFDLGAWHFISLPSAATRYGCDVAGVTAWLKADLAAHPNKCIFAYWHEPYFTSPTSSHPADLDTRPWLDALLAAHADILTAGHQNGNFEAFYPQNASNVRDDINGIQAFVAATGGQSPYSFTGIGPNLISRSSGAYGPLVFNLNDNGTYTWQFIKVTGPGIAPSPSSGSGVCR
ncbi:MAG: 1,4-beta cellobiohydrolase [Microgenomates group bacterium GW2011_GWC1_41_20]|uniref:Probable pectate lyase C n=2 Tax=Candidatus Woeseibacteriota TaxID=1752722 RepID=A0A1F8CY22_9BACT|nr:MAG: 1,4-beta cellobiohydrolase [Microgenomates group bacterium GW2011_GWC1_41_20]OGM81181.1 MAG: hypothetical protein A2393_01440 [Candidatus Woesebacteria bacterium RIFOXYB1_FULL_41_13]